MSPVLIVYLVTVALAFPLIVCGLWEEGSDYNDCALFFAAILCGLGPLVLLACIAIAIAEREPAHLRKAREAAEAAELEARKAHALADREQALGL